MSGLDEEQLVTCGYMRQNIIEDVWADIFGVAQSTISRYITFLTPFAEKATEEDWPTQEGAAEAINGSLIVTNLQGRITFVPSLLPATSTT
jgi:Helix-turn-helix of DDE superfamily endonuclease